MNLKSLIRLGFVIVVFAISVWYSLTKPVKLGLDLKGGAYVVLEAIPEGDTKIDNNAMNRLIEVLDRRVNGIGVAESVIQKAGDNRVIIELPGLQNTEDAINLIGKTALLEFKLMDDMGNLGETLLTGSYLKSADVSYDNLGRPQIQFEMTPEGAKIFAQITRENIGKQLAITLDGVVQTAPRINSEIPSGSGVITGNYTVEEAKATATLLNAGALPVKAEIVETRTVGATLGDESIAQSKNAAIVSIILIWAFMLILYKLPGIVANIAIILFGFITFATLNFIDATLTLPGIAGFILSLGMAVDANVVIFERIKEELAFGNTIRNSVESGFNKAFAAIFDSNITTLIVAAILFIFGTGPIKGFAVTLALGVAASMFTAITATKVILLTFINIFGFTDPKFFGVKLEGNK